MGTAIELLWGERIGPRRGPKPTLNLDAIAAAGIAIADTDGLAAVTMQRVAERVGVTKMALYRYVPGKDELVALMIDIGIGEPPRLAELHGGWRAGLEHWARHMFQRFTAHPWALDVTVGARAIGPNELGWLEEAVAALTGTGLTGAELLDVAATLAGQARTIAQQAAGAGAGSPEQALVDGMSALLAGREDRFPAVAAALADQTDATGRDNAFDFGVQRILDGVELLINRRCVDTDVRS